MDLLKKTLYQVAIFFDKRKVGEDGRFGFKRSSDLMTIYRSVDRMIEEGIIKPKESVFLDIGCADGRVNVFFSYLCKASVGIEIDDWSLDDYKILLEELVLELKKKRLLLPPKNIYLFHADATDLSTYGIIKQKTGFSIEDFDIFYTYLFMYEEIADLIRKRGKRSAILVIYGIGKIFPKIKDFEPVFSYPLEGILGIYRYV